MRWETLLKVMEEEARKRHAPVFRKNLRNAFKVLIFTILSARSRDELTYKVAERLFTVIKTPAQLANMKVKDVEKLIYPIGFYKIKAKRLVECAKLLTTRYNSEVPKTYEELIKLPGVGRKTANVVLANAFGKPALGVDVHVHRIANRLGLVKTVKPEETEEGLKKIIPARYLAQVNKIFVAYGQTICKLKPKCNECKIREYCRYYKLNLKSLSNKNLVHNKTNTN
ncbi:MAG TPA: endonuclease III [Candidatus Aenigmarchaeota archaeon]|nr:MAG: endonuclease III [Candidatus Aenigmarchaeota archaeon]HDD46009.1 endonuclease III [Candidatus Aenigmarchaeota archaeon]